MRLRLDPTTRRLEGGTVLVGGRPLRLVRLTARGAAAVDRLHEGEPRTAAEERLRGRLLDAGLANPVADGARAPAGVDVTVVIPHHADPVGLAATRHRVPDALVVDDAEGRGPAWARNRGWQACTTELVAFLDAGCVPADGWLARLLPHFGDERVAAAAPRVRTPPGPGALARYESRRSPLDRGALPSAVRPGARVPYVPTAALVVRRRDLESVGGFDEGLRHGEDVDLVWRLHAAGRIVRYEPTAVVWHPPRPTIGGFVRQRIAYGSSAAALADRHGDAVAPAWIGPWSLAVWGLAAVGRPTPALAVATDGVVHASRRSPLGAIDGARLAVEGQWRAGLGLAEAVRRTWWPLVAVAALRSRAARRVAGLSLAPLVAGWFADRPALGPARWIALRLLDDLSYGTGVWVGMARRGSLRAVVPRLGGPSASVLTSGP